MLLALDSVMNTFCTFNPAPFRWPLYAREEAPGWRKGTQTVSKWRPYGGRSGRPVLMSSWMAPQLSWENLWKGGHQRLWLPWRKSWEWRTHFQACVLCVNMCICVHVLMYVNICINVYICAWVCNTSDHYYTDHYYSRYAAGGTSSGIQPCEAQLEALTFLFIFNFLYIFI